MSLFSPETHEQLTALSPRVAASDHFTEKVLAGAQAEITVQISGITLEVLRRAEILFGEHAEAARIEAIANREPDIYISYSDFDGEWVRSNPARAAEREAEAHYYSQLASEANRLTSLILDPLLTAIEHAAARDNYFAELALDIM